MNNILKTTAIASMVAMAAVTYSTASYAQSNDGARKCIGEACAGQGMDNGNGQKMQNQNGQSDSNDQVKKLRKKGAQSNDQYQDNDGNNNGNDPVKKLRKKSVQSNDQYQDNNNNQMGSQKKMRRADWKYDNNRHQRRRSKDATFKFYFGGFYYPQPYWDQGYNVDAPYRISCGEGRGIVSQRFNRVRVVECSGRTFTYLGRRNGESFRVVLNSRSGRIISAREI